MRKITRAIRSNQMISGSMISLVGSNIANVFAYLYHFVLGRMLGKADYGELAVFLSILTLLSSTYGFLGTMVVKTVSRQRTEEERKVSFIALLSFLLKPALIISCLFFGIILLKEQLQLHVLTAVLIAPIVFVSFVLFLYKAYFQGSLRFMTAAIYSILELFFRLAFGAFFIYLGFDAGGAVIGFLVTILILTFFAYRSVPFDRKTIQTISPKHYFSNHTFPIIASSLATTAFFTVDLLLVRMFFTNGDSGSYAAAATLGRTVLFSTLPITGVLFPMISRKHAEGEDGTILLLTSLALTFLVGGVFAFAFYFIPDIAISVLYGNSFTDAVPLLFPYSIFMMFMVLSLVFVNYYLPQEKYVAIKMLVIASVTQIVGIYLFHNSLQTVLSISIIVTLALFMTLLIYFCYENRAIKHHFSKAFRGNTRV